MACERTPRSHVLSPKRCVRLLPEARILFQQEIKVEPNVVDHTSMWSLISNASIVVQLVMLTLVAASVTS